MQLKLRALLWHTEYVPRNRNNVHLRNSSYLIILSSCFYQHYFHIKTNLCFIYNFILQNIIYVIYFLNIHLMYKCFDENLSSNSLKNQILSYFRRFINVLKSFFHYCKINSKSFSSISSREELLKNVLILSPTRCFIIQCIWKFNNNLNHLTYVIQNN